MAPRRWLKGRGRCSAARQKAPPSLDHAAPCFAPQPAPPACPCMCEKDSSVAAAAALPLTEEQPAQASAANEAGRTSHSRRSSAGFSFLSSPGFAREAAFSPSGGDEAAARGRRQGGRALPGDRRSQVLQPPLRHRRGASAPQPAAAASLSLSLRFAAVAAALLPAKGSSSKAARAEAATRAEQPRARPTPWRTQ